MQLKILQNVSWNESDLNVKAKYIKLLEENIKKIVTLGQDNISQIGFKNHNLKK